jgi:hypothetical protein
LLLVLKEIRAEWTGKAPYYLLAVFVVLVMAAVAIFSEGNVTPAKFLTMGLVAVLGVPAQLFVASVICFFSCDDR